MAEPVVPFPGEELHRGVSGKWVGRVQARLKLQDTLSFGPTTEGVVKDWQSTHGLTPDGVIGPKTWTLLFDLGVAVVDTAHSYLGHRETGKNRSPKIDQWNSAVGAPLGSPWCASFACACVAEACRLLRIDCPILRSASSSALYRWARDHGRLTGTPNPGDLFLVKGGPTGHYHTGIVAGQVLNGRVATLEGNSNQTGSPEGIEVAYRVPGRRIDTCDFVRL